MVYDTHGKPEQVLRVTSLPLLTTPGKEELLVRMLAAPINPSDINQIQGVYPLRPSIPGAVGGNEGVAEVVAVGELLRERGWKEGQRVFPSTACFGTWRTHAIATEDQVHRIPVDVSLADAATISVNPCSAYRMLHDYVPLGKNDAVILNAANSGVGRAVLQLAQEMEVTSIAVIRDRPEKEALKRELIREYGASYVLTEEELRSAEGRHWMETEMKGRVALALNAVGGKSAMEMARCLRTSATFVTYGNMAREPLTLPASLFIFKDLHCRGFWMGEWKRRHSGSVAGKQEYDRMIQHLVGRMQRGQWKTPPMDVVDWHARPTKEAQEQFLEILQRSQQPMHGKKQLVRFL